MANLNGTHDHHTHLKRKSTCELLVRLVKRKRVPDSTYLRSSAKRVTMDQRYINKIDAKIEKDGDRVYYINVNKGVRRC